MLNDHASLIRPLRPEDYPAVQDIIARSFEDHIRDNPEGLADFPNEPWYDPQHLLVAEIDGRVVSQLGVRDGSLWIAGHPFPAGLLGTVCTHPDFRGRGIGARLVQGAFEWMANHGLTMSCLHTNPRRFDFYGRLGYRLSDTLYPKVVIRKDPIAREFAVSDRIAIRRATPRDTHVCNALYGAHYGTLSGGWSRTEAFWARRLAGKAKLWVPGTPEFWIAEDPGPVAYLAVVAGDDPSIIELAALPGKGETAARMLVGYVLKNTDAPELILHIDPRDPLCAHLGNFQMENHEIADSVMVRIQDRAKFLDHAREILSLRARAVNCTCVLHINESEEPFQIGDGNTFLEVAMSQHDLCAVVYNGQRLNALLADGALNILQGAEEPLRALFPNTHPARCALDGY